MLLSTVLQKLFGVELGPTFGVSHVTRERSTPLAYDLMEPFRPCVDWRGAQWALEECRKARGSPRVAEQPDLLSAVERGPSRFEVTKEFRAWVTAFPLDRVEYLGLELNVQSCIESVVRGFRRAVLRGDLKHYRPWIMSAARLSK